MVDNQFNSDSLILAGQALHGDRWQSDLAHDLGVSDERRIRQWLSGGRPIPCGVRDDLVDILPSLSRWLPLTRHGKDGNLSCH